MTPLCPEDRAAVLTRIVAAAPGQTLGRTAMMKLMYFLQELKGIPLGYNFTLYTYGPFDSDVLSDLDAARSHGALRESVVLYPRGYGYEITLQNDTDNQSDEAAVLPAEVIRSVKEVVAEFGDHGAAELELRSTILFVDREFAKTVGYVSLVALVERVRNIKPHFAESVVTARAQEMIEKGWLRSQPALSSPI